MLRNVSSFALRLTLVLLLGGLLAGFLGPWSPAADAVSTLRLHLAALLLAVGAAALPVDRRDALVASLAGLLGLGSALGGPGVAKAVAAGGTVPLKVMTLNVLEHVDNAARIAERLAAERPDVVLLQEMKPHNRAILARIAQAYPHQIDCAPHWACDVAIASRHPFSATQAGSFGPAHAKLAWARLGPEAGGVVVASVHVRWPLVSDQAGQLAAAWEEVRRAADDGRAPIVLAGDFNAVPWSAAVQGLIARSGLEAAGGVTPTWPRRSYRRGEPCLVCLPQLQLDHVLVSPTLRVVASRAAADVGSDHLPLIAELEVPRVESSRVETSRLEVLAGSRRAR